MLKEITMACAVQKQKQWHAFWILFFQSKGNELSKTYSIAVFARVI